MKPMFTTIDSQPQEWLSNDATVLHTICFCCFSDSANAKQWINTLVPKNANGAFLKWSGGGRRNRNRERRLQFIRALNENYDKIDFSVYCVSSTEAEISMFTQGFFWKEFKNVRQELDEFGRNCLVFKVGGTKERKLPALQAAGVIWIYHAIKYMKEVNNLTGFLYSDWLPGGDRRPGEELLNFLLNATGVNLQVSLPIDPAAAEADLLSDWFAGWCNSSKNGSGDYEISKEFETVIERSPQKIDWCRFVTDITLDTEQ